MAEEPTNEVVQHEVNKFDKDDDIYCCCCHCCRLKRIMICTCNCYSINSNDKVKTKDLRDYIYTNWAINGCQLFYGSSFQDHLVKYLGSDIATYFMIMKVLFIWILAMFCIGLLVFGASFHTLHDNINPATPICRANYSDYYMCPVCDRSCDFWYLKQVIYHDLCTRHFRLLFDHPVLWGFGALVLCIAVIINLVIIRKAEKIKTDEPSTSKQQDPNEHKQCSYGLCLIICKYLSMILYIALIGGLYFAFLMFFLFIEIEVRKFVNNTNSPHFLTFILGIVPVALLQTIINKLAESFYKFFSVYALYRITSLCCKGKVDDRCNCNEHPIHKFITLLVPNAFISYLPIVYRIAFYGNIVSDPRDGYKHIGQTSLRYQHCPSYGCMDVGAFIFLGIMSSIVYPSFSSFQNMFRIKMDCCKMCCKKQDSNTTGGSATGTKSKSCPDLWKSDIIDDYVDLTKIYGYVLLFISVTGVPPLLAALITIPIIARSKAISYFLCTSEEQIDAEKNKKSSVVWIWRIAFLSITVLGVAANIALVIPSSRFIQHISYSWATGYRGPFLNYDEYLDHIFPQHSLSLLVDENAFPDYTAHYLPMLHPNGEEIRNGSGEILLYLPFINFECLNEHYGSVGNTFTRDQYIRFIKDHMDNNAVLLYQTLMALECFNMNVTCRSRGFLSNSSYARDLSSTRKMFTISLTVFVIIIPTIVLSCLYLYRKKCKKLTSEVSPLQPVDEVSPLPSANEVSSFVDVPLFAAEDSTSRLLPSDT